VLLIYSSAFCIKRPVYSCACASLIRSSFQVSFLVELELTHTVEGVEGGITFKALSNIGCTRDFSLGVEAGAGIGVGIGAMETIETVGFDRKGGFEGTTFKGLTDITGRTEGFFPGTGAGVFGAVGIAGILEIIGAIVVAVEIRAARDAGVEASSCARHRKREVS
jgi:hypothetical protein